MQIDQLADQGQTDAKAFAGSIVGPLQLRVQLKDPSLHILGNADASVGDGDFDVVGPGVRPELDRPARRSVFGCVGQQIADDLR